MSHGNGYCGELVAVSFFCILQYTLSFFNIKILILFSISKTSNFAITYNKISWRIAKVCQKAQIKF